VQSRGRRCVHSLARLYYRENRQLVPNEEIVQTWRTSEFKEEDADSELIVRLAPVDGGSELTLIHNEIPEGQPDYEQGWIDHYLNPMLEHFGK
jgi:activator of HSP90 ATPase